jgi:hypothetical protein
MELCSGQANAGHASLAEGKLINCIFNGGNVGFAQSDNFIFG